MLRLDGPARLRTPLVGIALGGMVTGHALGYLAALPVGAVRAAHLAATGHGSFPLLALVALLAAGASLVAVGIRSLREARAPSVAATAVQLAGLQAALFLMLELAERGFDAERLLSDPCVRLGVVAQLLVALASAFLIRLLVRAVHAVAARPRALRSRAEGFLPAHASEPGGPPPAHLRGRRRRAPPLPLAARSC
jgi:hypothetical protein